MEWNNVTIIGIKVTKNKNTGRNGYTYYYKQNFSQYEVDNSEKVSGISCGSVYSGTDFNVNVGDIVELKYAPGYEGKAQLIGMQIIKTGAVK